VGVKFKDYYDLLQVSRSASEADIKNAYRKLARKFHPDLFEPSARKPAEERFKDINEAYEVLRDPEKRAKYNQLGLNWKEGMSFRPAPPPESSHFEKKRGRKPAPSAREWAERERERAWREEREEDLRSFERRGDFSDFFQSLFGEEKSAKTEKKSTRRTESKSQRGADIEMEMELTLEEVAHGTKRPITVERQAVCSFCRGQGFMVGTVCSRCRGSGWIREERELSVTIPAGVQNGDRIRLAGQGELGTGDGGAGDRFILVKFKPHPLFSIAEDHLIMDLEVMPWEAALGSELKILTLYGNVILKIPVNTRNGQQFRLRGRGLPVRKGEKQDLYVRAKINMPDSLTPEEREHYVELARLAKKR
jgi:curved DNA-binding protein